MFHPDVFRSSISIYGTTRQVPGVIEISMEPTSVILKTRCWIDNTRDPLSQDCMEEDFLLSHAVCSPQKRYKWGFASLLLFTHGVFTILYATIMAMLFINASCRSRLNGMKTRLSMYRDVLDLAAEIKLALGQEAQDMSVDELEAKIMTTTGHLRIDNLDDVPELHVSLLNSPDRPRSPSPDEPFGSTENMLVRDSESTNMRSLLHDHPLQVLDHQSLMSSYHSRAASLGSELQQQNATRSATWDDIVSVAPLAESPLPVEESDGDSQAVRTTSQRRRYERLSSG